LKTERSDEKMEVSKDEEEDGLPKKDAPIETAPVDETVVD